MARTENTGPTPEAMITDEAPPTAPTAARCTQTVITNDGGTGRPAPVRHSLRPQPMAATRTDEMPAARPSQS